MLRAFLSLDNYRNSLYLSFFIGHVDDQSIPIANSLVLVQSQDWMDYWKVGILCYLFRGNLQNAYSHIQQKWKIFIHMPYILCLMGEIIKVSVFIWDSRSLIFSNVRTWEWKVKIKIIIISENQIFPLQLCVQIVYVFGHTY